MMNHYFVYPIRREAVSLLLERQNYTCPICNKLLTARYHVDHDHETGYVRGILCPPCNVKLASYERGNKTIEPKLTTKMEDYLKKGPEEIYPNSNNTIMRIADRRIGKQGKLTIPKIFRESDLQNGDRLWISVDKNVCRGKSFLVKYYDGKITIPTNYREIYDLKENDLITFDYRKFRENDNDVRIDRPDRIEH